MTNVATPTQNPVLLTLASAYTADESDILKKLIEIAALGEDDRRAISDTSLQLVSELRSEERPIPLMDALLQEYGLSTEEGVALMRLSEALIRTPDFPTARRLVRDKLIEADWREHAGQAPAFLVNQATNGLRLSAGWIKASGGIAATNIAAKLGDRVLGLVMNRVMAVMAEHFVLGRTIEDAASNARKGEDNGQTYSYDMLGEAALTMADANTYFEAYKHAVSHLASTGRNYASISKAPGISVKLSALHPRYEYAARERCAPVLIDRLVTLAKIAKQGGLSLAIDAEETDRLELSLQIFDALLTTPELADWNGLGLVVQSYQRRAVPVLTHVINATRAAKRKITIRLVKGAYWDSEIKRAQELGLESYPVFTRKENTDVSYLACARLLLDAGDSVFPQFATHNAHTAAAIAHMAGPNRHYELQRLHGMGKNLHEALHQTLGVSSRVYAPVGAHEDLLPYLVRRLLENGANSSFVNQIFDKEVAADTLVADPIAIASNHAKAANPKLPVPRMIAENSRITALGYDLTQSHLADTAEKHISSSGPVVIHSATTNTDQDRILAPADLTRTVGQIPVQSVGAVDLAVKAANRSDWPTGISPAERSACLNRAADLLENEMLDFMHLCVMEAGKTLPDAVAEIREAVDFCRYYAAQAQTDRLKARRPLGTVACISPWNFPLAIFLGQVAAALSVGNTVVAKPAEQTPLISHRAMRLLYEAGIPEDAAQLLIGDGATLGTALTRHADIHGICFTGSTATAKRIASALAETGRATLPFIAETGGINTMIVDSTALLEQAVQDVVASAFQSTGQRCSACRIVCVQDEIADDFITMLTGAMDALTIGDPAKLSTDIGPAIDANARRMIETYIADKRLLFRTLGEVDVRALTDTGHFVTPIAFEINAISDVPREIFGPVLHVLRFKASKLDKLIDDINGTGFGLTMGLHTRLDNRIDTFSERAHVGNLYVNRNQIGAVVGIQPFGGEGLSGTGPKAGGPHYLLRLSEAREVDRNLTVQTEYVLPGPTGEQNTLRLHPRGTILCLGGDEPSHLDQQIALAKAAGNQVITLEKGAVDIDGNYDGIAVDGARREEIAAHLCRRDGAILPLLSAFDDPERYYHERTVTINTTAAGGNASLLAMS